MIKEIIIKYDTDETMVAVTEDQQLVEIYFEREQNQSILGNLYKGVVENVLPGMQAAFVNMGVAKNGFLYINDAVPRVMDADGNIIDPDCSIEQALKTGQQLLVQVMKEPVGTKGARITTHPTIPGRFVVLMPTVHYIGISRRIENEAERERLKNIADEAISEDMGVIIRTVAEGVSEAEIQQDIHNLVRHWRRLQQKALKAVAPSLVHKDFALLERLVRDIFVGDIAKIYANSNECKERLQDVLSSVAPDLTEKITVPSHDIMQVNDLTSQIDKALRYKVWLKCGGYLIIEPMEALTVIDVNTGKFVGERDLATTVLKTNIEAAVEIARQIRLRNIGGIIIVDFIDMKELADKEQVINYLAIELKKDRVKTNISGLTQLGLLEMTRKKNGQQLSDVLQKSCPFCNGKGKVFSEESVYINLKKEIFSVAAETGAEGIYVEGNPVVAAYLIGIGGANIDALESSINKKIFIKGNSDMKMDDLIVRPYYATDSQGELVSGVVAPVDLHQILDVFIDSMQTDHEQDGIARISGFVIVVENGASYVGKKVKIQIVDLCKTYAKAVLA